MKSSYSDAEAAIYLEKYKDYPEDLALRVYTSQLLGRESELVLHGGGNTSVKSSVKNIFGEDILVLYVKGSGWDLATIEPEGFPALDLEYLKRMRGVERLTDEEMVNQMRTHLMDASSPDPSVEALLHAYLPFKFIDHSHSDSIVILTNQKNNREIIREALGEKVAVLDFIMPGFPLGRAVYDLYTQNPDVEAIVLLNHGLFTFGDDARTSYERTIEYVDRAERYIEAKLGNAQSSNAQAVAPPRLHDVARACQLLRGALVKGGEGRPAKRFVLDVRTPEDIVAASMSPDAAEFCVSGLLTPDHVIRTKGKYLYIDGVPADDEAAAAKVQALVADYQDDYIRYFDRSVERGGVSKKRLDTLPRVFVIAGIGIVAAGSTKKDAKIAADLAEHTIRAKVKAKQIGEYAALPEQDLFDMEYWSLEQKKLGKGAPLPLQGQVALVTGGGGAMALGIGDRLLAAGAVLVLTDINGERLGKVKESLAAKQKSAEIATIVLDVTDYDAVVNAFDQVSALYGGIDILVPNAGIAHVAKIEELATDKLDQVMDVNFYGVFNLLKAGAALFARQGTRGNIVVNSSKNVFDPSPSFGAYSASKAAAHQISKIAAMELAPLGVRVNMINADAVFGNDNVSSGLWDVVGPDRMKARGLDPEGLREYYRERNLLKETVLAEHVGNAVVFFATEQTPTTGATLPVDGGIPNAFPR